MAQQSTTQLGTLEPFDGTDIADYSERLNSYFIANNIGQVAEDAQEAERRAADKRKVAVTISVIGKKTYSTLKDLCLPDLPADKTYEELTEILKGFYKPKVLEVAETYRFHHTVQSENESVTEYANKLKRLAVNCNFGQYLTRALRDQFVGGVRSQSTRKKLLSEDRTFDQALKVARAHELAEKEPRQFPLSEEAAKNQAVHGTTSSEQPHGITINSLLTKTIQKRENASGVDLPSIWRTSVPMPVLLVITAERLDTWRRSVLQKRIEKGEV